MRSAWRFIPTVALLLFAADTSAVRAQGLSPVVLSLTSDSLSAPVHTVVHLSASVQTSGSAATGAIGFLDGGNPIASVPLNAGGLAVLGVASLAPGTHTLTAVYAGDATHSGGGSLAVQVAVAGVSAPFTLVPPQGSVYVNQPVALRVGGLPATASGSISVLEAATTLTTAAIPGVSIPAYEAFGDGITSGQSISAAGSYPSLFASSSGFTVANFGVPESVACDVLPFSILRNGIGPTQTSAPLSSLMIGSTEIDTYGSQTGAQTYLPVFEACEEATLAWLAIPREYKVLPGDGSATPLTGTWTSSPGVFDGNYGTLMNATGNGTAQFAITSNGGPVYLWYLLGDAFPGSFTLAVDGFANSTVYSTQPSPAIGSLTHSPSIGYALLRFSLGAGPHTFDVIVGSGTVGILGVGTPPSAGAASVQPTVLACDIPNQLATAPLASSTLIANYTQAIQTSVSQFQSDGLDVRMVSTQQTMLGTAGEMTDQLYPNAFGHTHLAQALENAFGSSSPVPYGSFSGSGLTLPVSFSSAGTHTVTGAYSGDGTYAAGNSSPVTITVQPQTATVTSLSTRTTSYPAGYAVVLYASVTPATATGSVTLSDGTGFLAQQPLTDGVTTFTSSTLALGLHNLTADYNGDAPDGPSSSPVLQIQITPGAPTVTLSPVPPVSAFYGTVPSLTATLNPADATGTLTFHDSLSGVLGQATIAGGSATVDTSSLAVGAHTITVSYSGDNDHLPSGSAASTTNILPLGTTTAFTAPTGPISFGTSITLSAAVSPVPTGGTVIFRDSLSGVLGTVTVTGGAAILNTSALPPGVRILSADYSGDALHSSSISSLTLVTVSATAARVALAALPATLYAGSPLSLTATVTPGSATGTVLFRDAAAGILGQATINHGSASLPLGSLPAGFYSITAEYGGDADDIGASSAAISTQVVLQPSSITLASIAGPVAYSTALPLTASVSPDTAAGVVSFYDGTKPLGQALLVNGVATLNVSTLATGPHMLHVVYGGSAVYSASQPSSAMPASITPDSTNTYLTLAEVNVPLGAPVIFNVRVNTAAGSTPSGLVVLRSNGALVVSGPLVNSAAGAGYATFSIASAANSFGTFGVTAYYSGDANNSPSDTSGTPVSFTVVSSTTVTSLSLSSTQVPPQTPVSLTAWVRNPSPLIATGSMEFFVNGVVLADVPLDATGAATTTLGAQSVGSYTLSAQYVPSGAWTGSVSGAHALQVSLPVSLLITPNTLSLTPGASLDVSLALTPLSGFSGAVQVSCQSSAPFVTCSVDPPGLIAGPMHMLVHLAVAANTNVAATPRTRWLRWGDGGLLALLVPFLLRRRIKGKVKKRNLLALSAIALLAGCATGGNFGTIPAGRQLAVVSVTAAGTTSTAGIAVQVNQ